jgi:hypothetical protein
VSQAKNPQVTATRDPKIRDREPTQGPGHLATRFITVAAPDLLAAVGRIEQLLACGDR